MRLQIRYSCYCLNNAQHIVHPQYVTFYKLLTGSCVLHNCQKILVLMWHHVGADCEAFLMVWVWLFHYTGVVVMGHDGKGQV